MDKKGVDFKIYTHPHMEFFRQDKMSASYPAHFHRHYVVGCLLRGERLYSCASQKGKLRPLQLMIINPGEEHKCAAHGKTQCIWLAIHLPVQTMSILVDGLYAESCLPHFRQMICKDDKALEKFFNLIEQPKANKARELISQILGCVKTQMLETVPGKDLDFTHPFQRICPAGQINPGQAMSLSEMAAEAHMSKYAFLRKFKKITGLSPYRYMRVLRLNDVREALYGGMDLSYCAQTSGFYDQSHLNRQFTQNFGISPGRMRLEALRAFKNSSYECGACAFPLPISGTLS